MELKQDIKSDSDTREEYELKVRGWQQNPAHHILSTLKWFHFNSEHQAAVKLILHTHYVVALISRVSQHFPKGTNEDIII